MISATSDNFKVLKFESHPGVDLPFLLDLGPEAAFDIAVELAGFTEFDISPKPQLKPGITIIFGSRQSFSVSSLHRDIPFTAELVQQRTLDIKNHSCRLWPFAPLPSLPGR